MKSLVMTAPSVLAYLRTIGPEYREIFSILWDKIHGPGAWERNDWVWVYRWPAHKEQN